MNLKVIHIMDHPPAYEEFSNKKKPLVHWNLTGGNWIGIRGEEWGDVIGNEILKTDPEIMFEVWQPDLFAEKIYRHKFDNGLIHLLFPAKEMKYWYGVKKLKYISSVNLISLLEKSLSENTIIHLPFPNSKMVQSVISNFSKNKIVCTCLGDLPLPSLRFWKLNKNICSKINLIQDHYKIKRLMSCIDRFTIINNNFHSEFRKIYFGPYTLIPMGIDLNFWHPKNKIQCRLNLNLTQEKKILFSSSRLNSLKQVDRLIRILNKLSHDYDFLFVISGHGTRVYEEYLIKLAKPLFNKNQILFTGYIPDTELLDYYNASDVFILTSLSEGSPVAVQKALACNIPVLTTDVGYTAEVLKKYKAGVIVPCKDYFQWEKSIVKILEGDLPELLDLSIVYKLFNWTHVSQQFIKVFRSLK